MAKKDEERRSGIIGALWRGRPIVSMALGCVVVVAAYLQLTRMADQLGVVPLPAASGAFIREDPEERFRSLTAADLQLSRRQRDVVDDLARRYVGSVLVRGTLHDLLILQQILDAEELEGDQTFELQSLGVALGDVMETQLGLSWVVYRDELGESRALRVRETDTVHFPVTMISKRVEMGVPFSVEELYQKVVDAMAELPPPKRVRPVPPPRPRVGGK